MRLRQLTQFLWAHPLLSWVLVFLTATTSVIDVFHTPLLVSVPLLFGTLGFLFAIVSTMVRGPAVGGYYMLAATLPYLLRLGMVFGTTTWVAKDIFGMLFAISSNVWAYVIAMCLYRGMRLSDLLHITALLAVLAVCLIYAIDPEVSTWWRTLLSQSVAFNQKLAAAQLGVGSNAPTPAATKLMISQTIDAMSHVATGFILAGFCFAVFVNVVIARAWMSLAFIPGLFREEIQNIRATPLAAFLFVSALTLSIVSDYFPKYHNDLINEMMPIGYMLFVCVGLSLIHYLFSLTESKMKLFWMVLFYIFFIFAAPMSIILIAMIALFDVSMNFRQRFRS